MNDSQITATDFQKKEAQLPGNTFDWDNPRLGPTTKSVNPAMKL